MTDLIPFYDSGPCAGREGHCRARAARHASLLCVFEEPMGCVQRGRAGLGLTVIAALHLAAFGLLLWTEVGIVPKLVFGFAWGLLNFFWLVVLRRPAVSAALSLATIVVLLLLSRLKYEIIWTTANFLDLMIVNADTVTFLLAVKPDLSRKILLVLALVLPWLTSFGGSTSSVSGCAPRRRD